MYLCQILLTARVDMGKYAIATIASVMLASASPLAFSLELYR